ncbi:MAG: M48 family metalloprotease [Phycisphaeraceae bacterium]|nr:M48 family metalloprotease [Phycisphaeraceae bacterium]
MVQVTLIAAVLVLFMRLGTEGGPWSDLWQTQPWSVAAIINGGLLAIGLGFAVAAMRAGRRIDRGQRGAILRLDRWATTARLAAGILFGAGVALLGWLDLVRAGIGDWILLDELAALMPLLGLLVLVWWAIAPIERRVREAVILRRLDEGLPPPVVVSRWRHVLDQARHEAGPILIPLIPMLAWGEAVVRLEANPPAWLENMAGQELVRAEATYVVALLAGMAAVFACAPLLIRAAWSTTPIGASEIRTRIDDMCRRHRVRVRGVLMWRTRSTSPNAMVMGVLPSLRYILLSDLLLDALPARAVEAVAAHEVAHVRRRHIPWLVASVMTTVLVLIGGLELAASASFGAGPYPEWFEGAVAVLSLVLVLAVISWISKRFEWQADAFAAQHLSGFESRGGAGPAPCISHDAAATMAGALLHVATLAGMDPERSTWRHGSIRTRVERLRRLVGTPCDEAPIDAAVRRLKFAVVVLLVVALVGVAWLPGPSRADLGGAPAGSP